MEGKDKIQTKPALLCKVAQFSSYGALYHLYSHFMETTLWVLAYHMEHNLTILPILLN